MESKKVMVLGAGRGQIPIMEILHQYGYQVIAASVQGNYPGFKIADQVLYVNVADKENILKYALKEEICAIITDQLDEGVLTAAYVSEKMGLRGIGYEVAKKFTNKKIMRDEAQKAGIQVPFSICVDNMQDAIDGICNENRLGFPLMIKPVDSSASRGVYKVCDRKELENVFEKSKAYSNSGKVIIEEYIRGKEYVIDAYTREKQTVNLIVGHRDYFKINGTYIPSATVFIDALSAASELEMRLKWINKKLVESFGLPFGITHAEYLYDEETDKIYLVEIAARGGGEFISSELIPAACGVNANELLVMEAVGMDEKKDIKLKNGAAAYYCYLLPEGTINKIEGIERINEMPGVRKAFFDNIALGMNTKQIVDKSSRKGPILVQGKNKEECYEIINEAKKKLTIEIVGNDGCHGAIWS